MKKQEVKLGKQIKICPGKRHAWFESNVGVIRKPLLDLPKGYKNENII